METSYLLTWIIFTPLLFGLLVSLLPNGMEQIFRKVALAQTVVNALLATYLYAHFDGASGLFQFAHVASWLPDWGINYSVAIDGISLPLVMLTAYVAPVAILGTWPDLKHGQLKKRNFLYFA